MGRPFPWKRAAGAERSHRSWKRQSLFGGVVRNPMGASAPWRSGAGVSWLSRGRIVRGSDVSPAHPVEGTWVEGGAAPLRIYLRPCLVACSEACLGAVGLT